MSLRWFGGRESNSLVYNPNTGRPLAGDTGTVWADQQRTVRITGLVDANSAPIADNVIRSDDYGYIARFGVDKTPTLEVVWVDFTGGLGPLIAVQCNDRATYRVTPEDMQAAISESAQEYVGEIPQRVTDELVVQGRALWTPNRRRLGLLTNAVIVGSSNAIPSTWGPEFCATWGLTMRNFAAGGTGFVSSQSFLSQLQLAAADTAFANEDVALVVITDASNNIREWNNTGNTRSVAAEARAAFAYARETFPRARVVCIPVIWPADPVANVSSVPGGYQANAWPIGLMSIVDELKVAAALHNVEIVDESWTWLSGLTGVMAADGSVHPNAAGYTLVAQWLSKHLRGESTRKDTAWAAVPYSNASAIAGSPPLRWRREGWTMFVNGSVQLTAAGSGGATDFGTLPAGVRPPLGAEIQARVNGSSAGTGVQVYGVGIMRIWGNQASGTQYFVSGSFSLS